MLWQYQETARRIPAKIQDAPIWQKNQKTSPAAPIAERCAYPTGFALSADITGIGLYMRAKKVKSLLPEFSLPAIGIDLMGSDNAPHVILHALFDLALKEESGSFVLFGTSPLQKEFSLLLDRFSSLKERLSFHLAEDTILMEENPLHAIRRKKNSSICLGMLLLKEKRINAFVSAGNTGALMTAAKMYLSLLPDIQKPALLALIPTRTKPVAVLDLGASVSCKAGLLIQFAKMGAAYQRTRGILKPKIGLLNIGSEALKGTSEHRLAYQKLQQIGETQGFVFIGNVEAKEAFKGEMDVLVTDGFTGNIFLKTAEGIASLIIDRLQENIPEQQFDDLKRYLNDLQKHLHYAEYPGALLCGVNGIVVKCHGYSSPKAIMNGIKGALRLVKEDFLTLLTSSF